ncbi:MAG: 5'-deoxynucleotidase [Eubacteriales bacterium]
MSHFFAFLSKMKYIRRWGIMRNTRDENIQEHSLQAAMIAHALAVIKNRLYGGNVDPMLAMGIAMYHEAGEIITGDLVTPIKYFNPEINKAYKDIEKLATDKIFNMIPKELRKDYEPLFFNESSEEYKLVKAADKLCAYLKCLEELKSGNNEFLKAKLKIEEDLTKMDRKEVEYFINTFLESFCLTLDELN